MAPSTRGLQKQQQRPPLDEAAPSGLFLDVNDPAVEDYIKHMKAKYRRTAKEFTANLFAQVGLPADALEKHIQQQSHAKHSRSDNGKPAAAASTSTDCQSPVRKKQKSDSPVVAEPETPALEMQVLSEDEITRIRGCNKKELCAELEALGADHHMGWKKNQLIEELIAVKQAPPMPETQPVGFSKYAALDDNNNSNKAGCLRSAVQSPSKVSNDDSAAGAASKKRQPKATAAASSKQKAMEDLPPVGSVKRAIMEREALAGKKPELSKTAAKSSKKAAPKSPQPPPPPSPPQQPPTIDEDVSMDLVDSNELEAEVAAPAPKDTSVSAAKEPEHDEPTLEDDGLKEKKEQQSTPSKAKAPTSPPAKPTPPAKETVVDSDDMEVEPESELKPAAAPSDKKDDAEATEVPESQEFHDSREHLSESQEESQRNRRKNAVQERYVPGLQTIPGSTNKATPNKKIGHVPPGTVKSMTKRMQETQSAKKIAAPTTRALVFPGTAKTLGYSETDKSKAATTGGKAARSKMAATGSSTTAASVSKEDFTSKKIAEMRVKSKQQIQTGATKTAGSADLLKKQYASASKLGAHTGNGTDTLVSRVREKAQKQQKEETAASSKAKKQLPKKKRDLLAATKNRAIKPPLVADKKLSPYHKSPTKHKKTPEEEEDDNPYNLQDVACYPEDTYEMTDTEASDYEPDSDEEYHQRAQKKKPTWARSENLKKALDRQYAQDYLIDPDVLFGEVETCDLVAMFDVKDTKRQKRLQRRRSSGEWQKDRLTAEEKEAYKRAIRGGVACAM